MTEKMNRTTGLSEKERQDALRWYARQPEPTRVKIMKSRFKVFQSLKAKLGGQNLPLLEYAALCIALKTEGYLAEKQYRSKKVVNERGLKKIKDRRLDKANALAKPRRGHKAAKLAKKWGVVVELREEGHSLQTICEYLKKHHKLTVSRQYLHEKIQEWKR